jgi:PAS domain S-box-containing protein
MESALVALATPFHTLFQQPSRGGPMRILVVDDNEINRKLLRVMLTTEGHEAVEAADGVEAFEKLHSGRFDAVVTDILMPKMDGYRLCYKIRKSEKFKELPIVIYSSTYTSASDEQVVLKVGADRFLRKPAAPAEILRAIEEAVRAPRPRGEPVAPGAELDALKEYSEGMVRRLEGSNAELEAAQQRLTAAYDSLRESEMAYRELVAFAPTGIVRATAAGKVLAANAAFAGMLGYGSGEELLGVDASRDLYFDPAERAAVIENWARLGPAAAIEFRLKRRDGTPIWAEGYGRAVRDSSGDILRYETFIQDIDQRKKVEESLQKLLHAVEQSESVVFMTDPEGAITYVNPAFERVYGYSREETLGKTPRILNGGRHDRAYYQRFWQGLLAGDSVREEFVNRRRDGQLVLVESSVSPVLDARGRRIGFIAVQHDLTERKRSEEALRESEQRFSLAFHASPIPTSISEIETGRMLDVNEQFLRILGYSREEVIGKTSLELGIWADRGDHDRAEARLCEEGSVRDQLTRIRTRSGEIRDVVGSGVPIDLGSLKCVLWTSLDVTERRRAEKEMRKSEERFRKLFDSNTIGIVISDLSGNSLEANDGYLDMLGFTSEELLAGKVDWKDLTPAEYLGRDQIAIEELQRTGIASPWEKEFFRKDGTRVPVLIGVAMLKASEGSVIAYIVDLTERQRLEERFLQAQKMEAVGQLAGGVAHDFNNLLTVILGYSDLLAAKLDPGSLQFEELDEIRKAGERAASLTRQLLAFSRQQVLERKVLDVNDMIAQTEKMLGRLIGEDVELVTVLDSALNRVFADAGQLEQVIMNLAVNARDAMPRGGRLTIETANVEIDEAYARLHATVRPGSYVMIAVSDTGVGMNGETLAHMFEPFFTTKGRGKGTGLGLATVYGIVKQSGGSVWVYSEVGKGTTFKIYLPLVEEGGEAEPVPAAEPASLVGSETVLLVEDEEPVRALSRSILESYGYTVLEAASGKDGLDVAGHYPRPIHLVLTDVVMPEMGGSDMASRLEALRPGVCVLYMSGYTDDAVFRNELLEKGRVFLQKPFTPETLARKVREALGG